VQESSDNATVTRERQTTELPAEVREFCVEKQITDELGRTIVLAQKHFAMAGEPSFEVIHDPECGEHYLCIDIWALGEPEDVFQQGQAFLDSFIASIDRQKRNHLNVVYHST
jgi:hypothetical protein